MSIIFGSKREEVTGGWRSLTQRRVSQFVLFVIYYQGDKIKEDEVGGTYSTHWSDEKCIQVFCYEAVREETN
jgi:hypothetical protein